jgi:hypothetical protein
MPAPLIVYTLLSHTCRIVHLQEALLHRFLPSPFRQVVVQGPFGSNRGTAGGTVRLREGKLEILTLPEEGIAGAFWGRRMNAILSHVIKAACAEGSPHALVIHGDLLPRQPLEMATLLGGRPAAARGNPLTRAIASTWIALDLSFREPLLADGLTFVSKEGRLWEARDVTRANALETIGFLPDGYDDRWHFEACDPGWLHLDRQSGSPEEVPAKVQSLHNHFGLELDEADCEQVADAPFHHAIPSLGSRLTHYAAALARWIAAGRPLRSPAEVQRIYTTLCLPCPHYNPNDTCRLCGCRVSLSPHAAVNKIAMLTESCPDTPPRWTTTQAPKE